MILGQEHDFAASFFQSTRRELERRALTFVRRKAHLRPTLRELFDVVEMRVVRYDDVEGRRSELARKRLQTALDVLRAANADDGDRNGRGRVKGPFNG